MNYNWKIIVNPDMPDFHQRHYFSGQVSLDFIVWLVGNEKFTLICEGEEFTEVDINYDVWGYLACVNSRYDGYGDHLNLACGGKRVEALESLIEQLSESILSKVKVA